MPNATLLDTEIEFDPGWVAVEAIYGGHVVTRLIEAVERLEGFEPMAVTAHFLGSVRPGPARVHVELVHEGRATATVSVRLEQGHPRALAIAKLARRSSATTWDDALDLSAVVSADELPTQLVRYGRLPFDQFIDVRILPDEGAGIGDTTRAWVRLIAPAGAGLSGYASAPLLLDSLPPGLFLSDTPPANVPTVELTAHFAPAVVAGNDWHFVTQKLMWAADDLCIEESFLHAADGRVLARARQSRRVVGRRGEQK